MTTRPMGNSWSTLSPNGQRARYGVSYLRNVCAQAGVSFAETEPDEDVLAVDCFITFAEGAVRVQVKCTSTLTIGGKSKSWRMKPSWLAKWDRSRDPVYFVIVVVPRSEPAWLEHPEDGTFHKTAAFWQRAPQPGAKSISIPKTQRLTVATLETWHSELVARYEQAGER